MTKHFYQVGILIGLLGITATAIASPQDPPKLDWKNVCETEEGREQCSYCRHVGKNAYNATGSEVMREVNLGKISGVCWRPKDSIIGYSPAIPAAGIPAEIRRSPRNAYYYIIDDGGEKPFLRMCREIEPKDPGR